MKPAQQIALNPASHDEIDLSQFMRFISDARGLIIKCVVGAAVLSTVYALVAHPVYRSDMLFQIEEGAESSRSLLGDVSAFFDIKTGAATEVEILKSRQVAAQPVDALHLYISAQPRYFPIIGGLIARFNSSLSEPGLFGWGGFAWGTENIDTDVFDVPEELYGKRFNLRLLGGGNYQLTAPDGEHSFQGRIGATQTFSLPEGPVKLHVKSIDANPGTVFRLIRSSRLRTIEGLQDKLQIGEKTKQSDIVQVSLECNEAAQCNNVLRELAAGYLTQNVARKQAEAKQSLSFLNEQLPELKAQLNAAEQKYTQFRDTHGTIDLSAESQQLLQQSSDAQTKLLELQIQRQELLAKFVPTHPSVVAIDSQIRQLNDSIGDYQQRIKAFPDLEQKAVGLMRDVQVTTDLYTGLLNTAEQLKVVQAGKLGTVRLVDPPNLPEEPVKPRRALIIVLSILLGFALGVVIALVRKTFFNRVSDPQEIERYTGIDVFATIPHSKSQKELALSLGRKGGALALLAKHQPRDPAIESLRSLRSVLQFNMLDAQRNIVMLAGPTPGVGKSFVATNFAAVLAAGGKRVLLIDADLHAGRLNEYFDEPAKNGLAELLAGKKRPDEVVRRNIGCGFDFIPTGELPADPSALLLSPALREHLHTYSQQYDIVLIDTAPVLAVSDAQTLGMHAGAVFLVARYQLNKIGEIQESIKRLGRAGIPVQGVLLNGLKSENTLYGYDSKHTAYA
jgi:tyrosine-protein kinase Etk/Wzc